MPLERSGYVLEYIPGRGPDGAPALVVVVKRTYEIDPIEGRCKPADKQDPPLMGDALWDGDDPMKSSIRLEGEMTPYKRLVDVVVHGTAFAPGGRPSKMFDVAARIGRLRRSLRVFGPRKAVWQPPGEEKRDGQKVLVPRPPLFTEPLPIKKMPLRFENAYGGMSVLIPQDLEKFREVVKEEQDKQKAKEEEKKKEEADKKAADYKEKKDKVQKEFLEEKKLEDRFSGGGGPVVEGDEPEGLLAEGGTRILSKEEIARAEAEEMARRAAEEAEEAARQPKRDGVGVVLAEEVLDVEDYVAPDVVRPDGTEEPGGTMILKIADAGEVVESDDDWVEEELRKKGAAGPAASEDKPKSELPEDLPRVFYPANPVGKGFVLGNHQETLDGLDLPTLEDPDRLLRPEQIVLEPEQLMSEELLLPAGLGFVGKGWFPRSRYAGVPPEQLDEVQDRIDEMVVGFDPEDPKQRTMLENTLDYKAPVFSDRWYNGAPEPQQVSHLYGDEEVLLNNMSKEGTLFFKLPGALPWVTAERGRGTEVVRVRIDTLVVLADDLKVVLLWRGHLPYSGPDELAEYPLLDFDIVDRSIAEQREADFHDAEQEMLQKKDGLTQVIDLEQIKKLEAEEEAQRKKAAEEAAAAAGPKYLWTIEDEKGTRVEKLTEPGDVLHADDSWIEKAKGAADAKAANEAIAAELSEREARKLKKEALRAKLEELKQREAEEAAKAKKGKKADDAPTGGG